MKKVVCAIALLALVVSISPVFAQGPFTDVPTDHWAYQAVDMLTRDGIIVGYPDGTFSGKRAMTRFEFAQALSRAIPVIVEQAKSPAAMAQPGVTAEQLGAVEKRVTDLENKKPEVTKADLDALTKLVNEFKDNLTEMGVDIDALKRDVSGLDKRVTAIEVEMDRIKISGDATIFGISDRSTRNFATDRDGRDLTVGSKLLENIAIVRDIDLNIRAKVGADAKLVASINVGNYLNYLESVSDYVGGTRATGATDDFFPYYLYAQMPLGPGSVTVGRQPIQWTPYTLKMIDVDSYTTNPKTDSGDYPLDGISGAWKFGGVGVQLFAAKSDQNSFLTLIDSGARGLTSQPIIGLYSVPSFGPFNVLDGTAMGGLDSTDQLAGARVTLGTPYKGNLGLTFIQAGGSQFVTTPSYDQSRLMGADLNIGLGRFMVGVDWTQVDTLKADGVSPLISDVDDDNMALDANIGVGLGPVDIKAGWKKIERNFTAPGFWDKLGSWTNPTDVQGEYADVKVGLSDALDLGLKAEFLKGINNTPNTGTLSSRDKINYYNAGLKWGVASNTDLDLGYEWTKYTLRSLFAAGTDTEKFITIGLGHQFTPSASMSLKYQIVDFQDDTPATTVGRPGDSKGKIAVAQFAVKF